jgi:hypothetical protein
MRNHYIGDLLHTIGISGLSRVRTELLHLAIIPASRRSPHSPVLCPQMQFAESPDDNHNL